MFFKRCHLTILILPYINFPLTTIDHLSSYFTSSW